MRETICDQVKHVLVGQGVKNVFSVSLTANNVIGAKNAQPLRDGGHRFVLDRGQVSYTEGPLREACNKAEPAEIPQRPKDPGATLCRRFIDGGVCCGSVVIEGFAGFGFPFVTHT